MVSSEQVTFTLTVVKDPSPVINTTLGDLILFSYQEFLLPVSIVDPDGDTITYEFKQKDGSRIPSWLVFTEAT